MYAATLQGRSLQYANQAASSAFPALTALFGVAFEVTDDLERYIMHTLLKRVPRILERVPYTGMCTVPVVTAAMYGPTLYNQ